MNERLYETIWHTGRITRTATSIDAMITQLAEAVEILMLLRAAGVRLDPASDMAAGVARLVTENEAVAARYGLEERR